MQTLYVALVFAACCAILPLMFIGVLLAIATLP